jgi:hypothetical protein
MALPLFREVSKLACFVFYDTCTLPMTSATSSGWGDYSDALACFIDSPPALSSSDDTGRCHSAIDDALSNFRPPLSVSQNCSDNGWGSSGDALGSFSSCSESTSDAWGDTGDPLSLMLPSPSALEAVCIDLPVLTTDAEHWLNSDEEDDSRVSVHSGSSSPSTSDPDGETESDYQLSADEDPPNPSPPLSSDEDHLPRKCMSADEAFVGMSQMFCEIPPEVLNICL